MEKELDSKRFEHTLGVEYTAACLAMRYGEDISDARLAGLLHDCAKCLSDEKKLCFHRIIIHPANRTTGHPITHRRA